MKNYYAVLGVLPTADMDEIRSSYRRLAKRFHPDVAGGNAAAFARVKEAYEVLAEPDRRRAYDHAWRTHRAELLREQAAARVREKARSTGAPSRHAPAEAARSGRDTALVTTLTRVMSIALPRAGRFQVEGVIGNIVVQPTTPDGLWETTLRKFSGQDPQRLARHVVQIRLSGERDLVRTMMPRATDFGVQLDRDAEAEPRRRGFWQSLLGAFGGGPRDAGLYGGHLPLTLFMTVPTGTSLYLHDITGSITLGDLDGELVAKLLGGTMKAGRTRRAHLTLNGTSRAYLTNVQGAVDLIGYGRSHTYLGGAVTRLRTALENRARADVRATLDELVAEVNGQAHLRVHKPVARAQCVRNGEGRVELVESLDSTPGGRTGWRTPPRREGASRPAAG